MTTAASSILADLDRLGVHTSLDGLDLILKPASVIPRHLIDKIRQHKTALVREVEFRQRIDRQLDGLIPGAIVAGRQTWQHPDAATREMADLITWWFDRLDREKDVSDMRAAQSPKSNEQAR